MGFSAEMKDFLNAYKTGQNINASRTDQDYKEAATARTTATTARENDPDTLKTAAELERARLAKINDDMKTSAVSRGATAARTGLYNDQRKLLQGQTTAGSGLMPSGGAPMPQGQGALPIGPSTLNPDGEVDIFPPGSDYNPRMYADGGAVPLPPETPEKLRRYKEAQRDLRSPRVTVMEDLVGRFHEGKGQSNALREAIEQKAVKDIREFDANDKTGESYNDTRRRTRRYADGGLVDDEDAELVPDDEAAEGEMGALPLGAPPAGAPTDVSAQSRQPRVPRGLEGVISPALVADATKAGMTFGLNQYGLAGRGAVPSARTAANARLFAQGHGGLTEQEMQAARQTVDPEGKLTDSQRNMAALGSVYQFWANKGEPEKAQRVAFQMLQYYRNASQRYAAIAAKAAEGGNVDLATKAALKAYANVPDGNDLEIVPDPNGGLMYRLTNAQGEVVNKGIATPQQLAASAMGLATGGFDKAILTAAGAREDAGAVKTRGAGAGRPQSAADREKEAELPAAEIAKLKEQWLKKNDGAEVDENFWQEATNTAQGLMQQNPKMNANQAALAAEALLRPGANFKLKLGENEGDPAVVKFKNGMAVQLSEDQLEVVQNSRAARIKAAADKEAAAKAEGPGFASKAGGILKDIGGSVAKAVTEDVGRAGNAISEAVSPETAARAKSALSAAARMGGDAGAYIMDLIKKDLSGEGGITPERVGRDIVGAAGAVGDLFKNKGAIPVDEVGPAP